MDGTLVDVSGSYKQAIIETVCHVLPDASPDDVSEARDALRGVPKFNNDWDATYFILQQLRGDKPLLRRDDEWEEIRAVFQGIYLGRTLYEQAYGTTPPVERPHGLMESERPLISRETLERIKEYPRGIVTSRPRFEATHTISLSYLSDFFSSDMMVTLDEVENEKPHPEPLLLMKEKLDASTYFYVGDTVDDAAAARDAGYISVIIGAPWGDIVIDTVNDLPEALSLYDNR
jgi:HAD superfamily hydrolase (TIGR01548 family)